MIDICLVKYCSSEKDEEVYSRTCEKVSCDGVNLFTRDNTNDNIGLAKARNELAEKGSAPFICFMDFDFDVIDVNWDALKSQAGESDVGMAYPRSGGKKDSGWSEPRKVPCNVMLMRREVFEQVGGFDERYFVAYADWDLIQKIRRAGLRTLQHNESIVQHMGLSDENPEKKKIWESDKAVYRSTWGVKELEMKVIIYDKNNDHHPKWLPNLKRYLDEKGFTVSVISGVHSDSDWDKMVKGCVHLFMWNGAEPQYQPVKAACDKSKVGWSVVEVGWFPQSKNWFVDHLGINADASLMDDDFSWVTDEDYAKLDELREKYIDGRERKPEDYILVPLQLEWDTNIILHSPYKKMQEFINHCEEKFEGQRIIFKRHPHDVHGKYKTKHKLLLSGNFLDLLMKAKEVYGLNSTCLMESALVGVPVTQLGEGYLKRHEDNKERLLAALVAKQINVNDTDLSRWIDPLIKVGKNKGRATRVGIFSENRESEMANILGTLKNFRRAQPTADMSNIDIVMTDEPKVVTQAGRAGKAVVAMAVGDIPNMIEHEKDGLIYLSDDWARHWLSALTDLDLRTAIAEKRRTRQRKLDQRVTVIIPCYKHANLLARSVGSVVGQTVKASVVIVDDGSPDDVPSAVEALKKKWPDEDIKLVCQENAGLAAARNTGFREAKTGWVIPLDADDRLEPKFIEMTLAKQEEKSADVVYTDVTTDNHGRVSMVFTPNALTARNSIVCTCLVRKELWDRVGGYDETMKLGFEDWEFWIRCVKAGAHFVKSDGGSLFYYHDGKVSMLNETHRQQVKIISYMRSKHWKMFKAPRVSIVIPCYKQAHFIERCIKSIAAQTEKDVEVIVVSDGSPDNVKVEVDRAKKETGLCIRYVKQVNKGLSEARNAGIIKAKAEWILPLDADNEILEPEWLKTCLDAGEDAQIGVVFTDLKMRSGTVFNSTISDHKRLQKENTLDACALIRSQVLRVLRGYRPRTELKGHEDWDFWLSCIEAGIRFKKVDGVHILYDDVQPERMTPWLQQADTYWELLKRLKELHPKFFGGKVKVAKPTCDLTVVLSSYNQRDTLPMVLESYKNQSKFPLEVIINDDGSSDGTLEWLDDLGDLPFDLRYVTREHSWYRLASGNNSAAKHARGKRILFTNGDQLHSPKSFEAHCALMTNLVGGGVFKGIHVAHSKKVTMDMIKNWRKVKELQSKHPSVKSNTMHIQTTDPNTNPIGVWGGNFSVPADTFQQIGGYDEGYDVGWGGEENDLVRRCVKAGCRVEWVRGSEIFHLDHPIKAYAKSMLGSGKYIKDMT